MWAYVAHYVMFLLETLTIVVAVLAVVLGVAAIKQRNKSRAQEGYLAIRSLASRYQQLKREVSQAVMSKKQNKQAFKALKKAEKAQSEVSKRLYVIEFKGDIQASAVAALREEITAVLQVATPQDEVLVKVESPGGLVHGYGLAASQLDRVRSRGIPLTVAVDKVAASGGYMMACVANKIIAAPFAVIGSIGVVAQLPNFNRWLEKRDIDFEQLTAGDYKRTLTMFGKNTPEGRAKFQQELEQTHELFKQFVVQHRSQVDIAKISTGEHWFGQHALHLQLVDGLMTSDDYLLQAHQRQEAIFEVRYHLKVTWSGKMKQLTQSVLTSVGLSSQS